MARVYNHKYRRQKTKNADLAFVELGGTRVYLGPYGSAESRQAYDRQIAEWHTGHRQLPTAQDGILVVELIDRYWQHAQKYYRKPDGIPTNEQNNIWEALQPLKDLYGRTLASDFGPLALKTVRQAMITKGWCRTNVNKAVGRIRRMFRWASENEIVGATTYYGLQAVTGLRLGRSEARESEPVRPVPEAIVDATLLHATPTLAAMVRLQLLTGMRPGEVCALRGCDIERSGKVWTYRPPRHKTEHHGHKRQILIGPQAQGYVDQYLKPDLQACLFSPAESEAERRSALHAARVTPSGQGNRPGTNRKKRPQRTPGSRYTVAAYGAAIDKCCDRSFPPPIPLTRRTGETVEAWEVRLTKPQLAEVQAWRRKHPQQAVETTETYAARLAAQQAAELLAWRKAHRWSPNQLRHNFATQVRRQYGIDLAQTILGHRLGSAVTEIYAEANVEKAVAIVAKIG